MAGIEKIKAREILDSKGEPTVEAEVFTDLGVVRGSVPSGVSRGKHEAVEIRDGDKRFGGKGVLKAVESIEQVIGPRLKGMDPADQEKIDKTMIELDGTENKSRLGANAVLSVSIAVCRAGAEAEGVPLWEHISRLAGRTSSVIPNPCILMIEGGLHGEGGISVQEFMVSVRGSDFRKELRAGTEIYHELGDVLEKEYGAQARSVGLEGGMVGSPVETGEVLEMIMKAAQNTGWEDRIEFVLDVAASHLYNDGEYEVDGERIDREELMNLYKDLIHNYPFLGIEDPFSEEDWPGFEKMTERWGEEIFVIGDDLLVTNKNRIRRAVDRESCNGLILKPNQAGTVTEALEAGKMAQKAGWGVFVKHRSGETNDPFIADLAVGLGAGHIMAGAPVRGERLAKYNRLLHIETQIS